MEFNHVSPAIIKRKENINVCACVFSPLREQTVQFGRLKGKSRIKRGFCSWFWPGLGNGWVRELRGGLFSSLAPAAPGARRGQHTIAVGRTGTRPHATRNFLSLTRCSCVFGPIDTITVFAKLWSEIFGWAEKQRK